jgi:TRAP-type uncharacterized transport system substrate-binding protein
LPLFSRRFRRWYLRETLAAAFFLIAVAVGLVVIFRRQDAFHRELSITGGSLGGLRHQIARRLADQARDQGLRIRVIGSEGSKDALQEVDRGALELALVQGAFDAAAYPAVRQVAALHIEPLHLLVRSELHQRVQESLTALRGKTVNLSTPGSGTHDLALDVLAFAGLKPRTEQGSGDYVVSLASYDELQARSEPDRLPDAIFTVSDLPSPLARHLTSKQHYKLVALPFGEAFALESFEATNKDWAPGLAGHDSITRSRIFPTSIPPYTYGMEPPAPAAPLVTFGPRLLLVANRDVPSSAVRLVLEAVFSAEFSQYYRPPLDSSLLDLAPEYPWHSGTEEYREHHKPLVAGDVIDLLEKGTSLAGAIAGALFFLWQWFRQHYRRKRALGFETYMVKVAAIEQQALGLEMEATLNVKELLRLQIELNRLKNEALSRFAEGTLEGEALMTGFVTHINDARNYLTRLILHERDNLENRAEIERRPADELWTEAVGEWPAEIRTAEGDTP